MEEKLYFKPAKYGKGIKKNAGTAKFSTEDTNDYRIRNLIIFLISIAAVVGIIIWLLRGKTITAGRYPENIKNESVACMSTSATMHKINAPAADDKRIEVNAIFGDDAEVKSLSVIYSLSYSSPENAYGAEAMAHAEFNKTLAATGYDIDKFSNKFSRYENQLIISLSANKAELDELSAPYFLIKTNDDFDFDSATIEDYKSNYESQGFSCKTSEKGEK